MHKYSYNYQYLSAPPTATPTGEPDPKGEKGADPSAVTYSCGGTTGWTRDLLGTLCTPISLWDFIWRF